MKRPHRSARRGARRMLHYSDALYNVQMCVRIHSYIIYQILTASQLYILVRMVPSHTNTTRRTAKSKHIAIWMYLILVKPRQATPSNIYLHRRRRRRKAIVAHIAMELTTSKYTSYIHIKTFVYGYFMCVRAFAKIK